MRPTSPSEASEPGTTADTAEPALPMSTKTVVDRIDPYRSCSRARRTVSSHRYKCENEQELTTLPRIIDATPEDRDNLIIQKLVQCQKVFDFSDTFLSVKSKEVKRAALNELVDYFSDCHIPKPEVIYPEVVKMVATNLFRCLPPPPSSSEFDPEEDEPSLDMAWPHLQLVYKFFVAFIESSDFRTAPAKKCIDTMFVLNILRLFDSEDPRERDCLKTVLHRIYGKFVGLRALIRKEINNVFLTFVYETGAFNGIGELLEILGSVVTGFAIPLKDDHKNFLKRVLLPLHTPRSLSLYHTQLTYCVVQFVQKDPSLVPDVFASLFRFWPRTSSTKEILFLAEIDELLESVQLAHFDAIGEPLCRQLTRSFNSCSFQVTERTLAFWAQTQFTDMLRKCPERLFPIIVPELVRVSEQHWNPMTRQLTAGALMVLSRINSDVFKTVRLDCDNDKERREELAKERHQKWEKLEEAAKQRDISVP